MSNNNNDKHKGDVDRMEEDTPGTEKQIGTTVEKELSEDMKMQITTSRVRSVRAKVSKPESYIDGVKNAIPLFDLKQMNKKIWNILFEAISTAAMTYFVENLADKPGFKDAYDRLFAEAKRCSEKFSRYQNRQIEELSKYEFELLQKQIDSSKPTIHTEAPRRLRIAETVLSKRTNRIVLVMERVYDDRNQQAVLRTAECLGIQNICIVVPVETKGPLASRKITRGNDTWLTIKKYRTTNECIEALRAEGREIWATDLSPESVPLTQGGLTLPEKVAIIIGREADGCSKEMLAAADKRIYLPMFGFTESLNLSVASALVIQQLFYICPEARGNLSVEEKRALRKEWFFKLAKGSEDREKEYMTYVDNPPLTLDDLRQPPELKQSYIPRPLAKRLREKEALVAEEVERENKAKKAKLN
jgi:tRNA G18 (ribose-2'-O)-methylase SpoU